MIPFFQKKRWGVLFAQVFSLVLVISLALPTFAANAGGLEGTWHLIDFGPSRITLELSNGEASGIMYCNRYITQYAGGNPENCGSPSSIAFRPDISTTQQGCGESQKESKFLQSLEATKSIAVCNDKLTLLTYSGNLEFYKD